MSRMSFKGLLTGGFVGAMLGYPLAQLLVTLSCFLADSENWEECGFAIIVAAPVGMMVCGGVGAIVGLLRIGGFRRGSALGSVIGVFAVVLPLIVICFPSFSGGCEVSTLLQGLLIGLFGGAIAGGVVGHFGQRGQLGKLAVGCGIIVVVIVGVWAVVVAVASGILMTAEPYPTAPIPAPTRPAIEKSEPYPAPGYPDPKAPTATHPRPKRTSQSGP